VAIAFVQSPANGVDSGGGATQAVLAFGANVTAGSSIFVCARINAVGKTITVTDTLGNTYAGSGGTAGDVTNNTAGFQTYLYSAHNSAGGANTVTLAISGTGRIWMNIAEYSGLATSSTLDQTASATGASAAIDSGATATTTQASELVIGVGGSNVDNTFTLGTGFSNLNVAAAGTNRVAMEGQVVSSTGTYNGTFTILTSTQWVGLVATYKGAGGATGGPFPFFTRNSMRGGVDDLTGGIR